MRKTQALVACSMFLSSLQKLLHLAANLPVQVPGLLFVSSNKITPDIILHSSSVQKNALKIVHLDHYMTTDTSKNIRPFQTCKSLFAPNPFIVIIKSLFATKSIYSNYQ